MVDLAGIERAKRCKNWRKHTHIFIWLYINKLLNLLEANILFRRMQLAIQDTKLVPVHTHSLTAREHLLFKIALNITVSCNFKVGKLVYLEEGVGQHSYFLGSASLLYCPSYMEIVPV